MRLPCTLFLCLIAIASTGQNSFDLTYQFNQSDESRINVTKVTAHYVYSYGLLRSNLLIQDQRSGVVKQDHQGNILWANTYGNEENTTRAIGGQNAFLVAEDGGLFFTGQNIRDPENNPDRAFLMKIDPLNGDSIFQKEFAFNDPMLSTVATGIKPLGNNEYLLQVWSLDVTRGSMIVKIDQNGDEIWRLELMPPFGNNHLIQDVLPLSNDHFLVLVGTYQDSGICSDTDGPDYRSWIAQIDQNGNVINDYLTLADQHARLGRIKPTTGNTFTAVGTDIDLVTFPNGDTECTSMPIAMRFDQNLNPIWDYKYTTDSSSSAGFSELIELPNNCLLLMGNQKLAPQSSPFNLRNIGMSLVLDQDGNFLCESQYFDITENYPFIGVPNSINMLPDQSVIISGTQVLFSDMPPYNALGEAGWILRTTDYDCATNTSCQVITNTEAIISNLPITLFPNPAQDRIVVEHVGIEVQSFRIIDVMGRTVDQQFDIQVDQSEIKLNRLLSGTYILEIQTENGSSFKRFIKNE
ncbi:MAG: T9SS type A sorting domain-containing protein [Bacteroidota bacterium]